MYERVKLNTPHHHGTSIGLVGVKSKFRVGGLLTIQERRILANKRSGQQRHVTLEQLRLTQKDQIRGVLVTEKFQILVVPLKPFNVPGETFQRKRITIFSLRSFQVVGIY